MTHQVGDQLMIDGQTVEMFSVPPFPVGEHGIRERDPEQARLSCGICGSTACWREYIATWEIHNGLLYLRDIIGRFEITHPDPIPAPWVSMDLHIPMGERLSYVHMGFGSTYEQDRQITLERGRVVRDVILTQGDDVPE